MSFATILFLLYVASTSANNHPSIWYMPKKSPATSVDVMATMQKIHDSMKNSKIIAAMSRERQLGSVEDTACKVKCPGTDDFIIARDNYFKASVVAESKTGAAQPYWSSEEVATQYKQLVCEHSDAMMCTGAQTECLPESSSPSTMPKSTYECFCACPGFFVASSEPEPENRMCSNMDATLGCLTQAESCIPVVQAYWGGSASQTITESQLYLCSTSHLRSEYEELDCEGKSNNVVSCAGGEAMRKLGQSSGTCDTTGDKECCDAWDKVLTCLDKKCVSLNLAMAVLDKTSSTGGKSKAEVAETLKIHNSCKISGVPQTEADVQAISKKDPGRNPNSVADFATQAVPVHALAVACVMIAMLHQHVNF